jgi:hypothetical protein
MDRDEAYQIYQSVSKIHDALPLHHKCDELWFIFMRDFCICKGECRNCDFCSFDDMFQYCLIEKAS